MTRFAYFLQRRHMSKLMTANDVRKTFLDYFLNKEHVHIKSSSVKPFCDPTLEFVNAGMNQFKNVFLGLESVTTTRSCNSQKCIRVGGKHNDLNAVGYDTYHHTFFEMLGNWSFNDYFKKEACLLAWELLTHPPYSLDPKRMYVTYFGGDKNYNLSPDLETKAVWEEIGVSRDRILPFGMKDNFWEMGLTGPCGPCTEIHYDHLGPLPRPDKVNSGIPDLTELWNLVFIQYNRTEDGKLGLLSKHYVDTGMGLERLVALIQGKFSNYDTDLFVPLFKTISKVSNLSEYGGLFGDADKDGLDTGYRILADHARMFSVAIGDNVFPISSNALRRIIRKSFITAEKFVPGDSLNLLIELSKRVSESFSQIFPEIMSNSKQIEFVLREEMDVWNDVQQKVKQDWINLVKQNPNLELLSEVRSVGIISAYKELEKWNLCSGMMIPHELSLILYDRFGLNEQLIEELARICDFSVDVVQLQRDISNLKYKNKILLQSAHLVDIPKNSLDHLVKHEFHKTDDSHKYSYSRDPEGFYKFDNITSNIQAVIVNDRCLEKGEILNSYSEVSLLFNKTNCWSSMKGDGDISSIDLRSKENKNILGKVNVKKIINLGGYILHSGSFVISSDLSGKVVFDDWEGTICIDKGHRLCLMRNTSAVHLLAIVLGQKFIATLEALLIAKNYFTAKFYIYGQEITDEDIIELESDTNNLIKRGIDIKCTVMTTNDILKNCDTTVPGYVNLNIYKQFCVIDLDFDNRRIKEVTTGPVVLNSKDVEKFCIVDVDLKNRKRELILTGITGPNVDIAFEKTNALLSLACSTEIKQISILENNLKSMKSLFKEKLVPWNLNSHLKKKIDVFESEIEKMYYERHIIEVADELSKTLKCKQKYFIYYVGENCKLEKLTRLCPDFPVMLFAYNKEQITARCCVPKGFAFTAEEWVKGLAEEFSGKGRALKGHDPATVFYLKPLKLKKNEVDKMKIDLPRTAKLIAEKLIQRKGELRTKFILKLRTDFSNSIHFANVNTRSNKMGIKTIS